LEELNVCVHYRIQTQLIVVSEIDNTISCGNLLNCRLTRISESAADGKDFMKNTRVSVATAFWVFWVVAASVHCSGDDNVPVSALLTTDSAGNAGPSVAAGVFRLIALDSMAQGTGFLHKSGWIITAEHVVESNAVGHLLIILPSGKQVGVSNVVAVHLRVVGRDQFQRRE
jgi:hypothetical protein